MAATDENADPEAQLMKKMPPESRHHCLVLSNHDHDHSYDYCPPTA